MIVCQNLQLHFVEVFFVKLDYNSGWTLLKMYPCTQTHFFEIFAILKYTYSRWSGVVVSTNASQQEGPKFHFLDGEGIVIPCICMGFLWEPWFLHNDQKHVPG